MKRVSLAVLLVIGCGGPAERMPMPFGAQMIFTQRATCPTDRITVTPRPDVPPHTILARHGGEPPAEIAADPERMQLWLAQHGDNLADIDTTWRTYEVRGCNLQELYVCQHPSVTDFDAQNGTIVGDRSARRGAEVLSAVRCETNAKRQLELQSGAMGDIHARMEDPNVPVLAAHTPLPTIPPALRGLRVLNTEVPRRGVEPGVCHALAQKFAALIGWTPVELGQPADIIMKTECFASAAVTHGARMFELLPLDRQMSISVSAVDGTLLEQFPPFPPTFACPTPDDGACSNALEEYAVGTMASSIATSARIADYVTKHHR